MERVARPFQEFSESEAAGGVLATTAVALAWANSPLAQSYFAFWELKFTIGFEGFAFKVAPALDQRPADGDFLFRCRPRDQNANCLSASSLRHGKLRCPSPAPSAASRCRRFCTFR
jgi:Na+/H+ antiporter 1